MPFEIFPRQLWCFQCSVLSDKLFKTNKIFNMLSYATKKISKKAKSQELKAENEMIDLSTTSQMMNEMSVWQQI